MDDKVKSFRDVLDMENRLAFQMAYAASVATEDEEDFSPIEGERFAPFYASLRDGIQDAYLYRDDFETWKKYRTRDQATKKSVTKVEETKRKPVERKLYTRYRIYSGSKEKK